MYLHGIVAIDRPWPGNGTEVSDTKTLDEVVAKFTIPEIYWSTDDSGALPLGHLHEVRAVRSLAACRTDADRGLWDVSGGYPYVRVTIRITDETRREVLAIVARKGELSSSLRREARGWGARVHAKDARTEFRLFVGPGW